MLVDSSSLKIVCHFDEPVLYNVCWCLHIKGINLVFNRVRVGSFTFAIKGPSFFVCFLFEGSTDDLGLKIRTQSPPEGDRKLPKYVESTIHFAGPIKITTFRVIGFDILKSWPHKMWPHASLANTGLGLDKTNRTVHLKKPSDSKGANCLQH